MQLSHITTRDLLDIHPDLMADVFPGTFWQQGSDGILAKVLLPPLEPEGEPVIPEVAELPAAFSSESIALYHWSDETSEYLNNDENSIITLKDNADKPIPVLNIPSIGFFRLEALTSNQSGTVNSISPAFAAVINRWCGYASDDNTFYEGTELQFSLGGWEAQIATAYQTLLNDLTRRKVQPSAIEDGDATYSQALSYKALSLVFRSLTRDREDNSAYLADYYANEYDKQLSSINTTTTTAAVVTWGRIS